MAAATQTRTAANQFSGTVAGQGLFSFSTFDAIPRTTRVVVSLASYAAAAGGVPATEVEFWFRRAGGVVPTERVLLGRFDQLQIEDPSDGSGDVTICGKVVPRDADGSHWELQVITTGKTVTATATVDTLLQPFPDTTPGYP